MKKVSILRFLVLGGVTIVASIIFAAVTFQFWLVRESAWVQIEVRPAVQSVRRAYLWSKLTGSYWENEMLKQSKKIARLPLNMRVEFYREIIVHCDLDTSRAILFVEVVGEDIGPLNLGLENLKTSSRFAEFEEERRNHVEDWSDELRAISTDR